MKRYTTIAVLALLVACGAATSATAAPAACPNAAFRVGASAQLPDCRAYELVSPADKGGVDAYFPGLPHFVAGDGEEVVYGSLNPFAGSPNSINSQFLSFRGARSWETVPVSMPITRYHYFNAVNLFSDFACDGCRRVVGTAQESADPGDNDPGPFGDAPDVYASGGPGDYDWVSRGTIGGTAELSARYGGRSADGTHVAFDIPEALTEAALAAEPGAPIAYERDHGTLRIVGLDDSDQVMAAGSEIGGGSGYRMRNAVSADGSKIFFQSGGHLYLRENGSSTTEVSAPQCSGGGCGAGLGRFVGASRDGSSVLFLSDDQLLDPDVNGVQDLYRYETANGELTLLIPPVVQPAGTRSIRVFQVSDDGSHVYFLDDAILTTQPNARGLVPQGGTMLYSLELRAGEPVQPSDVRFIATVANSGELTSLDSAQAAITREGGALLFAARSADPGDLPGGEGVYLYKHASEDLTCVSCPESGIGGPALLGAGDQGFGVRPNLAGTDAEPVAFFEASNGLLPRDVNGKPDVYQYRAGRLSLISSGISPAFSRFVGADASGDNVFVALFDALSPHDTDQVADVYDARVNGGFPPPEPAPRGCEGAECQGRPASTPPSNEVGSSAHRGNGNQASRRAKCVVRAKKARKAKGAKQVAQKRKKARNCRKGAAK